MRHRGRIWTVVVTGVVIGAPVTLLLVRSRASESAFDEQIRLARAEGLPTSADEFAALVKPAKPDENAASLYRSLRGRFKAVDLANLDRELVFHPNPANIENAKRTLEDKRDLLDILDRAVRRPRCWFDRDWKQGYAVLMPEYADMRNSAKLIVLQGSLAAQRGDVSGALGAIRRTLVIGDQAGEEPTAIAHLIREAIYHLACRELANWAFVHPNADAYLKELRRVTSKFPRPDQKQENADELFNLLMLVDQSTTISGRRQIGLREEDVPTFEKVAPLLRDRVKARMEIVKAEREMWAALGAVGTEKTHGLEAARSHLESAMSAFPTALTVFGDFGGFEDPMIERVPMWEARQAMYVALDRALSKSPIPKTIRTSDLVSPFDHKPLTYTYDGKQIVIELSRPDGDPVRIKIPPDFKKP